MTILSLGSNLYSYLVLAALLFSIGLFGLIRRKTFIGMLISAELILPAASINFMAFSHFLAPDRTVGQIFTLFIMGIAAAESAIILSIIIAVYRNYKSIGTRDVVDMKG